MRSLPDDFAEGLKNGQLEPPRRTSSEHWAELEQGGQAFAIIPASPPGTAYDRVAIDNVSLSIEVSDLDFGSSYYEGWIRSADSAGPVRWDAVLARGALPTRHSELLLAHSRLLAMRYRVPVFLFHPAGDNFVYRVDASGLKPIGEMSEGPSVLASKLMESGEVSFDSIRSMMGVMDRRIRHSMLQSKGAPINTGYELHRDETQLYGKKWVQYAIRSFPHQRQLAEWFGESALVHACRLFSAKVLKPEDHEKDPPNQKQEWFRDWVLHAIYSIEYQQRHVRKFGYDALVEACRKYDAPIGFNEHGEMLTPRDPRLRMRVPRVGGLRSEDLQELYRKYRHLTSILSPYPGADVVRSESSWLVLDHQRGEVSCFLTFDESMLQGQPLLTAEEIWRNAEVSPSAAARTEIFWKLIFPIHERVATGDLEADLGQGFWQNLIVDALRLGLKVTFVDLRQADPFTEIHSHDELGSLHRSIWGEVAANRHRMIVISRDALSTD